MTIPPPDSIKNLPGLKRTPKLVERPGVYFLVRDDKVVYVGQSVTPIARATVHWRESAEQWGKKFDRVYHIPLRVELLNAVEGALIRAFRPEHNGKWARSQVFVAPKDPNISDSEALALIGLV